jgi:hypothetical protein
MQGLWMHAQLLDATLVGWWTASGQVGVLLRGRRPRCELPCSIAAGAHHPASHAFHALVAPAPAAHLHSSWTTMGGHPSLLIAGWAARFPGTAVMACIKGGRPLPLPLPVLVLVLKGASVSAARLPKQPTAVSRARVRGDTMTTSTLRPLERMWRLT